MAITVKSMATSGVDGFMVEIEASTIRGQQQMMSIIGLPDQAIKEAGERIQAAIESCGYDFPKDKSIISLAPGDKKKRGSHFDLGMIIALLYQTDQISPKNLSDYAFIGELALDGRIRPCNGVLSMVTEARKCKVKSVVVPFENRQEAASVSGINVCPVKSLPDTVRFLEGRLDLSGQAGDGESLIHRLLLNPLLHFLPELESVRTVSMVVVSPTYREGNPCLFYRFEKDFERGHVHVGVDGVSGVDDKVGLLNLDISSHIIQHGIAELGLAGNVMGVGQLEYLEFPVGTEFQGGTCLPGKHYAVVLLFSGNRLRSPGKHRSSSQHSAGGQEISSRYLFHII